MTVGLIGVALRDAAPAQISCGHQGVQPVIVCEVGSAAGQRLFDELTKIREALEAAHAVLVDLVRLGGAATPAELHLARVLNDLEMTGGWQETLLDWATRHNTSIKEAPASDRTAELRAWVIKEKASTERALENLRPGATSTRVSLGAALSVLVNVLQQLDKEAP
jgi:hypothetical protein